MFGLLLMGKPVLLLILVLIDFALYFIPICILCLIPNLLITLIWFVPSIYRLYSLIFAKKEWDLRIRISLFFVSPVIIVSFIPICIGTCIGYSIRITLIFPLMTVIQRPEYPFHSLSSTAAFIHLTRFASDGRLMDSLVSAPFKDV